MLQKCKQMGILEQMLSPPKSILYDSFMYRSVVAFLHLHLCYIYIYIDSLNTRNSIVASSLFATLPTIQHRTLFGYHFVLDTGRTFSLVPGCLDDSRDRFHFPCLFLERSIELAFVVFDLLVH